MLTGAYYYIVSSGVPLRTLLYIQVDVIVSTVQSRIKLLLTKKIVGN